MQKEDFSNLMKVLLDQGKVERPTYLGHFQAYDSLILNHKNESFFYNKKLQLYESGKFHSQRLASWFSYESIIFFWYLYHIIEGGNRDNFVPPQKLTQEEKIRISFLITKYWQDKLPDHGTRLDKLYEFKDPGKLDLFITVTELLKSNTPEEDKTHNKLDELGKKINTEISDEALMKEFFHSSDTFITCVENIGDFKNEILRLTKTISSLFKKNIFMGFTPMSTGASFEEVVSIFPYTFVALYIFKLELDRTAISPKIYYNRLKKFKKSTTAILTQMKKSFSSSDAQDIGWVDTVLVVSPVVTLLNNLDSHMKYYRKKFKSHIDKTGQTERLFERHFIKIIYSDLKKELKAEKLDENPIDILLDILNSIDKILVEFNKIFSVELNHVSFDYDNIRKIINTKFIENPPD